MVGKKKKKRGRPLSKIKIRSIDGLTPKGFKIQKIKKGKIFFKKIYIFVLVLSLIVLVSATTTISDFQISTPSLDVEGLNISGDAEIIGDLNMVGAITHNSPVVIREGIALVNTSGDTHIIIYHADSDANNITDTHPLYNESAIFEVEHSNDPFTDFLFWDKADQKALLDIRNNLAIFGGDLNVSGIYYGDGSQLTGIIHTTDTNRSDADILSIASVYNDTTFILGQSYQNTTQVNSSIIAKITQAFIEALGFVTGSHTIDTNRSDADILSVASVYNNTNWVLAQNYSNGTESDPVYSAWDKSSGISITTSQVSDHSYYGADLLGFTVGEIAYGNALGNGLTSSSKFQFDGDAIQFSSVTGSKIKLYGSTYALGVESSELRIASNADITFRTDGYSGSEDVIITDNGDLNLTAGIYYGNGSGLTGIIHTIDTNRSDADILSVASVYNDTSWVEGQGYSIGSHTIKYNDTEAVLAIKADADWKDVDWNNAYNHLSDSDQAHSDYLKNDADDSTTGKLTAVGGFVSTIFESAAGNLKLQAGAIGDVVLFSSADVDNADDGREIKIWRNAPEGNNYIRTYITSTENALLHSNTNILLQNAAGKNIQFNSGQHVYLNLGDQAGSDEVRIRDSGGLEVGTIDSNGNVWYRGDLSIGVSSDVLIQANGLTSFNGGDFAVNTSDLFVDVSSGNVGIGVSNPSQPLTIMGNGGNNEVGITQNQVGGTNTMELTTKDSNGSQATRLLFRGGSNTSDIEFYTGGSGGEQVTMFIEGSNGFVGIGTITPGLPLEVRSADDNQAFFFDSTAQAAGTGGGIAFGGKYNDAGGEAMAGRIEMEKSNGVSGDVGFDMLFETQDSGGSIQKRMILMSNGYVGIGDITPGFELEVDGAAKIRDEFYVGDDMEVTGTLTVDSRYVLEGEAVGNRNILRKIQLKVEDGATPGTNIDTAKFTTQGRAYNSPSITDANDLAKSGTSGSYSLSANGENLLLNLTETVTHVLSIHVIGDDLNNGGGGGYYVHTLVIDGDIQLMVEKSGSETNLDWTDVTNTASDHIIFDVQFITLD